MTGSPARRKPRSTKRTSDSFESKGSVSDVQRLAAVSSNGVVALRDGCARRDGCSGMLAELDHASLGHDWERAGKIIDQYIRSVQNLDLQGLDSHP